MRQSEKKYLPAPDGGGNFDDADFVVGINQWQNMENCRVGSTDKGVVGTVESVGSTILKSVIEPSVTFVEIGSAEDTANRRFVYFYKNLHGPWDKILCYDLDDDIIYTVLLASQVTGGLGFDKNKLIQARIINGLLYWTDFLNQPRRINLEAAINMNHPGTFPGVIAYTSPMTAESITIIRKPPAYPVTFTKFDDATIETNQIKNNAFRFTYQYEYRYGEISTLAPHSLLAPYNFPSETFNSIEITVPLTEIPDQDVQIISLIVIYADGEQGFVIKRWDKANATDAAEIAAHVAGTTALSFEFANDAVGEAVNSATLVKPFDSVPLLSETLEQGTNRLFLGRNLIGYDTPVSTGISVAVVSSGGGGGTIIGEWKYIAVRYEYDVTQESVFYYYFPVFPIAIDGSNPAGYYDLTASRLFYNYSPDFGSPPSLPSSIMIADYTFISADTFEVYDPYILLWDDFILPFSPSANDFYDSGDSGTSVETTGAGLTTDTIVLKSDSSYRVGVVFYDQYLRQCGVVAGPKITTPDREYTSPTYDYGIQWTLQPGPQLVEIPDWAYYYSVVSTKSMRTSFFMQARAGDIVYATKDSSGNYLFTSTTYADTNAGVALKLDLLNGIGMGYSFQQGDIVKIYISGSATIYTQAVIDQSGEWLVAELVDLGSMAATDAFFEIYTPRIQTAAELYYEIGIIYRILDPGTTARRYNTLTGFLPGDVYLLTVGTSPAYITENMSPNTTYWINWFTNTGRVQLIDRIGQRFKDTSVKWSNTFIPGTRTNGLSTFDALDEKILPGELGPLRKLIVTSKVNNELGAVMLGICEAETASMYLGEQQLLGSAGNAFIAQADNVIGTVNILKGSFGTINPESVVEFRGMVFWYDAFNGKIVQYAVNGLFPISEYKMTRFWKLFSDQYLSMTQQQIEDLGSRPFVFMAVDPHHWELLVTVPKILSQPPKGYLPDIPSMIYPFDIYDGQAKTLVYKLNREPNFWQGAYSMTPEGWVTIQNKLFSFKFGQLYQHNSTQSYGNFYGIDYKSRIMVVFNQIPSRPKVYNSVSVESNLTPQLAYFYADTPYQQSTDLVDTDYRNLEGILYATLFRNKLVPTATGFTTDGLLTGEKMRTTVLKLLLEFIVSNTPLELRFIEVGYQLSAGHTTT